MDYYTRHPSTGHLTEAYYYAGRVYQDLENVGNIILSLRDLGRTYSTLKDSTKAVRYYYKADSLAKATNHTAIRQMVTGELCGMLTKMDRFDEAKETMNVLRTQTGELTK